MEHLLEPIKVSLGWNLFPTSNVVSLSPPDVAHKDPCRLEPGPFMKGLSPGPHLLHPIKVPTGWKRADA